MKGEEKMKSKDLDLMSVSEACQRLHVSRNTLYSLLESGDLKGFKVGRMWRIPDRSIWNYMILRNKKLEDVYNGKEDNKNRK